MLTLPKDLTEALLNEKNFPLGTIGILKQDHNTNLSDFHLFLIFNNRGLFDQNSLDRNCVLSLDRNYVNHLTEFHLTKSVDRIIRSTD